MKRLLDTLPKTIAAELRGHLAQNDELAEGGRSLTEGGWSLMRHDAESATAVYAVFDMTGVMTWTYRDVPSVIEAAYLLACLEQGASLLEDSVAAFVAKAGPITAERAIETWEAVRTKKKRWVQ